MTSDIYQCKRIAKVRDWNLEKGDVGYLDDKDCPEQINDYALLLSDVASWEDYFDLEEVPYFIDKKPKVRINFIECATIIIFGRFEDFTLMMLEFRRSSLNVMKN